MHTMQTIWNLIVALLRWLLYCFVVLVVRGHAAFTPRSCGLPPQMRYHGSNAEKYGKEMVAIMGRNETVWWDGRVGEEVLPPSVRLSCVV